MSKRVNNMKYHYTYRITNIKEGMYYYGVHSCDCSPKEDIGVQYWSTSKRDGFVDHQKQNPEQYKYKVLKIFSTRVEAVEHEIFLHKKFDVKLHKKFYNDANQESNKFDTTGKANFIDENGDKIFMSCEEAKLRGLKGPPSKLKGTTISQETKNKISKSHIGIIPSKETREKLKKPKSPEHIEKMRQCQIGKKYSQEVNMKKGSPGELNGMYGKHHTAETKEKMKKPKSDEAKENMRIAQQAVPDITCTHCGKIGKTSIMKRWHFDNCKLKLKDINESTI